MAGSPRKGSRLFASLECAMQFYCNNCPRTSGALQLVLMARLVDCTGSSLRAADVRSIAYQVCALNGTSNGPAWDAYTGETILNVADVIRDTVCINIQW